MQVGDLVQWTHGEESGTLGIVVEVDEMGYGVHWSDGLVEWYEYWGRITKYIRKL
jgi:hypothetical protein